MKAKTPVPVLVAATMMACTAVAGAAEATGDYARDLATVYGGYQRLVALKEACDTAMPATREPNDRAYAAWQGRHRALLEELQRRVTAMIRLASQDEKDYARNLGKYEGAILQERQEYKELLLALGAEELRGQCQRLPETLKGPSADLGRVYAAELAVVRKRK